jgi:hypothetical protein
MKAIGRACLYLRSMDRCLAGKAGQRYDESLPLDAGRQKRRSKITREQSRYERNPRCAGNGSCTRLIQSFRMNVWH